MPLIYIIQLLKGEEGGKGDDNTGAGGGNKREDSISTIKSGEDDSPVEEGKTALITTYVLTSIWTRFLDSSKNGTYMIARRWSSRWHKKRRRKLQRWQLPPLPLHNLYEHRSLKSRKIH